MDEGFGQTGGAGPGLALLVANPRCLAARGLTAEAVRKALRGAGVRLAPVTLEPDTPPAELAHRARALGVTTLVAAGGDGTVNLVANAAAPAGLHLAILPLGTANDFARGLGVPTALREAAALVAEGAPRAVDLGRVNGRLFLNAAHLGMGAEVARRADERLKRWLGPVAYLIAAVGVWRRARPLELALRADGQSAAIAASQVTVANGRYYGGGTVSGPDATLEDGLLDVQVLAPHLPAAAVPRVVGALRRGELADQPEAMTFRTARLAVTLGRPSPINLDGEVAALGDRLDFEVVPGALQVVAPAVVPALAGRGG